MPNNTINISFDLLGLQGASRITGKDGRDYVAICLHDSRVNAHGNGKCYLSLDVKANRDGESKFGQTHFVAESTTKEERQSGVKLKILGNGKEFVFDNGGQQNRPSQQRSQQTPQRPPHQSKSDGAWQDLTSDDSEVPF